MTEAVQQNPELSADARQKLLKNIHSTTLAGNSARTHRAHSLKCNENATPQELVKYPRLFNGGRVAQLAEHLLCKQGVGGSSPPTSTIFLYRRVVARARTPASRLSFGARLDSQQVGMNLLIAVLGGPEVERNERQFIHDRHGVPIFS